MKMKSNFELKKKERKRNKLEYVTYFYFSSRCEKLRWPKTVTSKRRISNYRTYTVYQRFGS